MSLRNRCVPTEREKDALPKMWSDLLDEILLAGIRTMTDPKAVAARLRDLKRCCTECSHLNKDRRGLIGRCQKSGQVTYSRLLGCAHDCADFEFKDTESDND